MLGGLITDDGREPSETCWACGRVFGFDRSFGSAERPIHGSHVYSFLRAWRELLGRVGARGRLGYRVKRDLLGRVGLSVAALSLGTSIVAHDGFLVRAFVREAHEWCLACDGLLVPCFGSDNIPSWPIQFLADDFQSLAPRVSCVAYLRYGIRSVIIRKVH